MAMKCRKHAEKGAMKTTSTWSNDIVITFPILMTINSKGYFSMAIDFPGHSVMGIKYKKYMEIMGMKTTETRSNGLIKSQMPSLSLPVITLTGF